MSEELLKAAHEIGANGVPHNPDERALFEEYMRGHCWLCDSWIEQKQDYYDAHQRVLYAVWRARGALTVQRRSGGID